MNDVEMEQLVSEVTRRVSARLPANNNGSTSVPATRVAAPLAACPFGIDVPANQLAAYIDHTLLRVDATHDDLHTLCGEALEHGFASVCVNAANVRFCATELEGSQVMVVAVTGFPLGAQTTVVKACEAREAVGHGAREIDMVLNVGALKSRDYATVFSDIRGVVEAATPRTVKVILETGALTREQKIIGCALAKLAGAAFVKTSTGFGPGGATADDVALMREIVGPELGVKASGGIRTAADARAMILAGANRIGASASVAIVTTTDSSSSMSKGGGYG